MGVLEVLPKTARLKGDRTSGRLGGAGRPEKATRTGTGRVGCTKRGGWQERKRRNNCLWVVRQGRGWLGRAIRLLVGRLLRWIQNPAGDTSNPWIQLLRGLPIKRFPAAEVPWSSRCPALRPSPQGRQGSNQLSVIFLSCRAPRLLTVIDATHRRIRAGQCRRCGFCRR